MLKPSKTSSFLCVILTFASATVFAAGEKPAPIDPPILPPTLETPAATTPTDPSTATTPGALPGATPGATSAAGAIPGLTGTDAGRSMGFEGGAAGSHVMNDFQGEEIGNVLRLLSRQAKVNMVISDEAIKSGTVTMRLENMEPMEAIRVIVQSKNLFLDELSGVYYVKTQGEKTKEPRESGNYTFSYAKAELIKPMLDSQLDIPAGSPATQFDPRTNTIFYSVGKSNVEKIKLFLETIDRPTQQVMIEARLVEVTANPKQSYGINWAGVVGGSGSPQTFRYGGTTPGTAKVENGVPVLDQLPAIQTDSSSGNFKPQEFLRNGAPGMGGLLNAASGQLAILSAPQMSVTLRFLNEDSDAAEFLANPRIVTANNQKAEIKITRNQPVPNLNFNEQTATAVFSGFQDKEFGNTLTVTPSINKDNFVTMQVKPEISNKVADATFIFGGAAVSSPVIDKRTLESNVLIKSGDTLAIGGLLQDEVTKGRTKVPILGDIPGVGYLFQEKLNSRTKRNLLVFVTPTIIKQGYGTGLEDQVSGIHHSGEEFADPNGWRNNAKGSYRVVPTSNRQMAADYPKPGTPVAPEKKVGYRTSVSDREK